MSIGSRTRRMMATLLMLSLALALPAMAAAKAMLLRGFTAIRDVGAIEGSRILPSRNPKSVAPTPWCMPTAAGRCAMP
jgi:hypothetical protein